MLSAKIHFILAAFSLLLTTCPLHAQETPLYNPQADAKKEISEAVKRAKAAHKNVFLQIGGKLVRMVPALQ